MYPEDLKYHGEHGWVKPENGKAVCGISFFAQKSLGDIVYVELPEPGTEIQTDTPYGEVESSKAVSDLISPVSGKIVAINEKVIDAPELINEDPYGEGWLMEVELSNPVELDELMNSSAYESSVAEE